MIIATRKIVYKINDNEFETVTECKNFDNNATFTELKELFEKGNKNYHFYASPVIQIQFIKD